MAAGQQALIEAEAGYRRGLHEQAHAEFFYLLEGMIRNQGQLLKAGDASRPPHATSWYSG
jgi:hypothetical protein